MARKSFKRFLPPWLRRHLDKKAKRAAAHPDRPGQECKAEPGAFAPRIDLSGEHGPLPSPGTSIRHYAPRAVLECYSDWTEASRRVDQLGQDEPSGAYVARIAPVLVGSQDTQNCFFYDTRLKQYVCYERPTIYCGVDAHANRRIARVVSDDLRALGGAVFEQRHATPA